MPAVAPCCMKSVSASRVFQKVLLTQWNVRGLICIQTVWVSSSNVCSHSQGRIWNKRVQEVVEDSINPKQKGIKLSALLLASYMLLQAVPASSNNQEMVLRHIQWHFNGKCCLCRFIKKGVGLILVNVDQPCALCYCMAPELPLQAETVFRLCILFKKKP